MRTILVRFYCFVLLLSVSSCYSNRNLVYLQDRELSSENSKLIENRKSPYRLQANDILSVQIKGSAGNEVSSIFNVSAVQNMMFASPGSLFLEGYNVDAAGKISLPVIGELKVDGLTLEEV